MLRELELGRLPKVGLLPIEYTFDRLHIILSYRLDLVGGQKVLIVFSVHQKLLLNEFIAQQLLLLGVLCSHGNFEELLLLEGVYGALDSILLLFDDGHLTHVLTVKMVPIELWLLLTDFND